MKKPVTIIYDYFGPAYKAGGPVQSLTNLVSTLKEQYDFSIITGAYDKGEKDVLKNITPGKWNQQPGGINVFYWVSSFFKLSQLIKEYKKQAGQIIYINGIYSFYFNILPLIIYKKNIVLAPRGMLHGGALSQKSFKKKIYLFFFKLFGWHKKILFHATDDHEKEFIQQQFGNSTKTFVAPNIPKNLGELPILEKKPGQLSLVSVALVGPMKNYHLVLASLKNITANVVYNIYGPVINESYWNECLVIIKTLPPNIQVNYRGELVPENVKAALEACHIFILPSVSENFGHAIFESLSAAKPVITSNNTPWKNLQALQAGWNTETTVEALTDLLRHVCDLSNDDYVKYCKGAKAVAVDYLDNADFSAAYKQLFGEKQSR